MNPPRFTPRLSRATKAVIFGLGSVVLLLWLFSARDDSDSDVPSSFLWNRPGGSSSSSGNAPLATAVDIPQTGTGTDTGGETDMMAGTNATAVDLGWYAPAQTLVNNLTHVVANSTTGVYGFIYDSSYTPDDEYGTYNWCNMPHVRKTEYVVPDDEYELVYVELVSDEISRKVLRRKGTV